MALDRQKILTELGSVMNQLKSVDCGCMGKIFGNSGHSSVAAEQRVQSCGGHQQSCCNGNIPNCRWNQNSFQGNRCCSAPHNIRQPYTDLCNLPKLYSDTYSYLNQNLMQPTMKEVYNDLKSLTPANTVINNPLAGQMGLTTELAGQGNSRGLNTFNEADKSNMAYTNQASKIGGMGPQIMSMLEEKNVNNNSQQSCHVGDIMANNSPQSTGGLPHVGDGFVSNQCLYQSNQQGNKQYMPLNTNHNLYGQHTEGIAKFKEMFPDAMKKDLGYDPMAIAIQMNPANQKQVAVDSVHKVMFNKQNIPHREVYQNNMVMNDEAKFRNSNQTINQNNPVNMQCLMNNEVYKPGNAVCTRNLPTLYEENVQTNAQPVAQNLKNYTHEQHVTKEPIFPADTSKYSLSTQKYPEYNTLGQPIETLPADIYHTPLPSLPQTLSPQPAVNYKLYNSKYSNVKSTVSKTSLLARKPLGKAPSRNQLQHVYNQYKGSQSYTHQNLKDPAMNAVCNSDARLRVPHINAFNKGLPYLPIEKVGGDSTANNSTQDPRNKTEQVEGQIGDAPNVSKLHEEHALQKIGSASRKCRNGLQDVVFTSYPTSAAWSFHGNNKTLASAGYRYHKKI